MNAKNSDRRDHNPFGFTSVVGRCALKGGTICGAADEFGFKAVEKRVYEHDIQAIVLHRQSIEHVKRGVHGNVLHELIS